MDLAHKLLATLSFFAVFPCFLYMVWHLLLMYLNTKLPMLLFVILLGPLAPLVPYLWNDVGRYHQKRFLLALLVTAPTIYLSWTLLNGRSLSQVWAE